MSFSTVTADKLLLIQGSMPGTPVCYWLLGTRLPSAFVSWHWRTSLAVQFKAQPLIWTDSTYTPIRLTSGRICFWKSLKQRGQRSFVVWLTPRVSSTMCSRSSGEGSTGALPRKGIWPCRQCRNVLVTGTPAQCHQPFLRAPASKSFFTAAHRVSEFQKPQNPRGSSWHKNGEKIMNPSSSIWPSRYQTENRSRINGPGDFQKAHPRCVDQGRDHFVVACALCKPERSRFITESQTHYSKRRNLFPLIAAFLFRTCW